jgi:endonuclease/exonuclease/phosphatase family metal-dependent hydrolase
MPDYSALAYNESDSAALKKQKKRAVKKLELVRQQLSNIPRSQLNYNLLLATWNIREFDSNKYGERLFESNYYIAEILSKFDVIAIQEVHRSTTGLEKVMRILGDEWKYIISDATEGSAGNDERIAYVYNSRKIRFGGLSGELVVPPREEYVPDPKKPGKKKIKYTPLNQLWRTPLISGFTAGWAKFMLCNVHIMWGESEMKRKEEIDHLASFLKERSEDPNAWARKLILLGDFNISSVQSSTYKMLKEAGYESPVKHMDLKTTTGKEKHQYDRIFVRERESGFEILNGGKIDLFENLFREDEESMYKKLALTYSGKQAKKYKDWRTYQLSDHEPLWVEFRIQYEDEYLERIAESQS